MRVDLHAFRLRRPRRRRRRRRGTLGPRRPRSRRTTIGMAVPAPTPVASRSCSTRSERPTRSSASCSAIRSATSGTVASAVAWAGLAATPHRCRPRRTPIGGHVSDPRAIDRLVSELSAPNPLRASRREQDARQQRDRRGAAAHLLGDASPTVREAAAYAAGVGEVHDCARHARDVARRSRCRRRGDVRVGDRRDRGSRVDPRASEGDEGLRAALSGWRPSGHSARSRTPAPAGLIPALRDADPVIRAMTADVLGELENTAAIAPLERALASDSDARVREAAARSARRLERRVLRAGARSMPLGRGHSVRRAAAGARRAGRACTPRRQGWSRRYSRATRSCGITRRVRSPRSPIRPPRRR